MVIFNVATDGSFGDNDGKTHGGIVFMTSDMKVLSTAHVETSIPEFVSMRNVGGEVLAAWSAILAVASKVKKLNEEVGLESYQMDLVYDYEGVGKWINGQWQCKKNATRWYKEAVTKLLESVPNLKLNLIWVKGHQNHISNEWADKVAAYDESKRLKGVDICNMDDVLREEHGF